MFQSKMFLNKTITFVAIAMCAFHIFSAWFGATDALILRSVHLGFALVLAFLISMEAKNDKNKGISIDLLLIALSLISCGYVIVEYEYIINRMTYVDSIKLSDWLLGTILIVIILEATRRIVGWTLPCTAAVFLLYAVITNSSHLDELIEQMYLGTEGIFGIPIYVSATYVILFIIFGALVDRTGTGKLFMDFALGLTGRSAGGPAKVSCLTSGMFGTVSGSAVANVMTTGTFTIPMMKRIGYSPGFSGGVEAVASTGGQIMPPIMGAAAFIMAEFLGTSYLQVATYALIPATLYYLALFMTVHFEAKKLGMHGLPSEELPRVREVLKSRGHLFLPLIIIVGVLLAGYSAPFAALLGIASTIPTALLRKTTRHYVNLTNILGAFIQGAKNTVTVALACACAGIVIGVIFLSGLGLEFTNLVLQAASNHLIIALILTMVAGIILGMGMPTAAAYIMQTALLVPALVKLGILTEAAHMFVFYFAILSAITPPVALAVYAANGISGANLMSSSIQALRLGLVGYIIPFMFVFGPSLLMIGSPLEIIITGITAALGVICLAAGLSGYMISRIYIYQRIALLVAALTMIKPGYHSDIIGVVLLVFVFVAQLPTMSNTKQ